jgi:hypothetical protein
MESTRTIKQRSEEVARPGITSGVFVPLRGPLTMGCGLISMSVSSNVELFDMFVMNDMMSSPAESFMNFRMPAVQKMKRSN